MFAPNGDKYNAMMLTGALAVTLTEKTHSRNTIYSNIATYAVEK